MRRQDIESELSYVQNELNRMGDAAAMRSTFDGLSPLKALAFRIGCCRAALDTMEGANLHPPTPQGQNAQSSTSPVA